VLWTEQSFLSYQILSLCSATAFGHRAEAGACLRQPHRHYPSLKPRHIQAGHLCLYLGASPHGATTQAADML